MTASYGRLALSLTLFGVLAGLVEACSRAAIPSPTAVTSPEVCRVGPDGGPLPNRVVDRGIGGTGAPVLADRGIGGTGAPVLADRGIGGTGIIAVITGFASVCLAGQEVALPSNVAISIGDAASTTDALRVGQLAVVDAVGPEGSLSARRVAVLFAASGPVDAVDVNGLQVAGQRVATTPDTSGTRPTIGDWVSISGPHRPDGVIQATRIDPREPGPAIVSGTLLRQDGSLRIGTLPIAPTPALELRVGTDVTVTGPVLFGEMQPTTVTANLLTTDPVALFAPDTSHFLFEGYRATSSGRLVPDSAHGIAGLDVPRSVLRLDRGGGSMRGPAGGASPGVGTSREPFAAAPVPDRALTGPATAFRGGGQSPGASNAGGGRLGLAPPHADTSGSASSGNRPPGGPAGGPGGASGGAGHR